MKKYSFVYFTLLLGIILDIMPLGKYMTLFRPYWTLMIVIFWALYLRKEFGITHAWFAGLLLDISKSYALGLHGFTFVIIIFLIKRNYQWFREISLFEQTLIMLLLFLFQGVASIITNGFLKIPNIHVSLAIVPIILSTVLWPILSGILSELALILQIDEKR